MKTMNLRKRDGRVVTLVHRSSVLEDNPLGDPSERSFDVWLPREYDSRTSGEPGRRFPVLYDLVGFTGSGKSHTNWKNFGENVPERAARLVATGKMAPCIIVFPDCFTSLGGNQYINSSALGNYADYLTKEIVPFIDSQFRTLASREHRGAFGKSSGGYGAMLHGMKYPATWGAIANHSGDAYFDFVYRADWPAALDVLARHRAGKRKTGPIDVEREAGGCGTGMDDGRVARFLKAFHASAAPSSADIHTLMSIAMAASYDPDPQAPNGFRLPFDLETGELIASRWRKWLRHDPINLVARYADNMRALRGIFIDCGWRDQYRIHYGTRILSRRLAAHDVPHVYEEFDGTHSGIDFRMDVSLPFLSRAVA